MRMRVITGLCLVGLVLLVAASAAWATDPSQTRITVGDMHCMGCAKKMSGQLQQVPGVAAVSADVPSTMLLVTPRPQQIPSPRAMWEAIEKAGYKPTKLEGPAGTFTARPQS